MKFKEVPFYFKLEHISWTNHYDEGSWSEFKRDGTCTNTTKHYQVVYWLISDNIETIRKLGWHK